MAGNWFLSVFGIMFDFAGFLILWNDVMKLQKQAIEGRVEMWARFAKSVETTISRLQQSANRAASLDMNPAYVSPHMAVEIADRRIAGAINVGAQSGAAGLGAIREIAQRMSREEEAKGADARQTIRANKWALWFVIAGAACQVLALFVTI